ncbi:MAG TPA: Nif3-like dinuclear metal center hexameric protein, partial [Longimicrobiales bacterium]
MQLDELVAYLDAYLRVEEVPDAPTALNGLQVANTGTVTRVAAAVDASERTLAEAVARGANFVLVHHGLFWSGAQPV